jgi:hypothetical protein
MNKGRCLSPGCWAHWMHGSIQVFGARSFAADPLPVDLTFCNMFMNITLASTSQLNTMINWQWMQHTERAGNILLLSYQFTWFQLFVKCINKWYTYIDLVEKEILLLLQDWYCLVAHVKCINKRWELNMDCPSCMCTYVSTLVAIYIYMCNKVQMYVRCK